MKIPSLVKKVTVIIIIFFFGSTVGSYFSQETILDAENSGKYEALIAWNTNGYNCDRVGQFKQVIEREVYRQCESLYASNMRIKNYNMADQMTLACKVGADEVRDEKIRLCNHHDCEESGKTLAGPVTAILCRYIHSPWMVEPIPESCFPSSLSSCIENTVTAIKRKVENQECQDINSTLEGNALQTKVRHICDSFIHAYSTVHQSSELNNHDN